MASNCKTVRAEIEEATGGAWLSRAAEEHVGACAGCLGFKNERESLRHLVGGLERVEAPGDFEFRLRARMAAAKEGGAARFSVFRLAPGLAASALAAVFVASIAAAYYFQRAAPTAGHATSRRSPRQSAAAAETAARQSSPASAAATAQTTNEVADTEDRETVVSPPVNVERVAAVRQSRQERRRASARAAVEPRAEVAGAREAGALEFGLSTSQVIKGSNVKLEVSGEPLRVVLRDERGTPHRLAMRPVSFGAQNPVGKRRELTATTIADNEGVW